MLTVAQIVAFGNALDKCEKTSLTWDEAKPYLIEHVRSTQLPLPAVDNFPEIAQINKQGSTLDKAEVLKLVDVCYGLDCDIWFNDGFMSFESGVKILTTWAQHTHATSPPVGLERIAAHTCPSYEIRTLLNTLICHGTGAYRTVSKTDDIFKFNAIASEFCAAHVLTIDDNDTLVHLGRSDIMFAVRCTQAVGEEFGAFFNKK